MNLIFQGMRIKREPLEITAIYSDLDDLKIMKYSKRKIFVFKDITTNLSDAITHLFDQLDLFFKVFLLQVEIHLGDGHIQFMFKDKEQICNSKIFAFSRTNKEVAEGIRNVCKIAINQIRKENGLKEEIFDDLLKTKIGIVSAQDIKKRTNLSDVEIEAILKNAQKHIDKLLKEKPYLYKKEKEQIPKVV